MRAASSSKLSGLWASPVYRFRVPDPARPKTTKQLIEVVFDVTLSAPSFDEPSEPMKAALIRVTQGYIQPRSKILDFGAGKLRNALFLLKRGFHVAGVEFANLSQTDAGKKAYEKARRKFPEFWTLVYPSDFFSDSTTFDLVLLINVLNIMPVPAERLLVLQESYRKLNRGGYLLWYSQYGDADYKRRCTDDVRFGDGYYIGKNRKFKTFYREFSDAEMDGMMLANGFEFEKSIPVPHNHVRFYRKSDRPPPTQSLTLADLQREIPRDVSIPDPEQKKPKRVARTAKIKVVRPDPPSLSIEEQYIEGLAAITTGQRNARKYHSLITAILKQLFMPGRLRRIKEEFEIDEGRKRIDIVCPTGDEGFFHRLNSNYHIPSPLVIIECKNYSADIANPEFDQLAGRLNRSRGMFGLLICRKRGDSGAILARCRDARKDGKTLIVLDDADVGQLLRFRLKQDTEAIDNYLEDKLLEVID